MRWFGYFVIPNTIGQTRYDASAYVFIYASNARERDDDILKALQVPVRFVMRMLTSRLTKKYGK